MNVRHEPPTPAHVLLVFSGPVAGREDEYNDWYDNVHVPDLLRYTEVIAAQRFRLGPQRPDTPPAPGEYLAIYELGDDPESAVRSIGEAVASGKTSHSDAVDSARVNWVYRSLGPRHE